MEKPHPTPVSRRKGSHAMGHGDGGYGALHDFLDRDLAADSVMVKIQQPPVFEMLMPSVLIIFNSE